MSPTTPESPQEKVLDVCPPGSRNQVEYVGEDYEDMSSPRSEIIPWSFVTIPGPDEYPPLFDEFGNPLLPGDFDDEGVPFAYEFRDSAWASGLPPRDRAPLLARLSRHTRFPKCDKKAVRDAGKLYRKRMAALAEPSNMTSAPQTPPRAGRRLRDDESVPNKRQCGGLLPSPSSPPM